jgi:putative membrane protein
MGADLQLARPSRLPTLPASLGCTAVALQIAYPLLHGTVRDRLTVAIVVVFAAACVAHAVVSRGPWFGVAMFVLTAVPGFAVEVLGVHTGVPFGSYSYATTLGPRLFGVPLVIGLAWTMLAWPAAIAARRLVSGFVARVLVGGWALAAADLFLDPQLVAAGQWTWRDRSPHLPGVASVPLSNYGGWLLAGLVLSVAVQRLLDTHPDGSDTVPVALYLWLYAGWIVALAVFLDLPAAAGWGALGMGTVAIPLALRVLR